MRKVLKVISYILAFCIMLMLFLAILLGIITNTILDQEYVFAKLDETNYYEKAYDDVIDQIDDYIEQSGLEEINIRNVIRKDEVAEDINQLFKNFYKGKEITINQDEIAQQLKSNLEEELEEKNITLTKTEQAAIDQIIETVADEYSTEILYGKYLSYLDFIPQIINTTDKTLSMVEGAIYVIPIILIAILLVINCKLFRRGVKYLGISLLSTGILLIFVNVFIKIKVNIEGFFILSKSVSDLIINIALDILGKINIIGIISTILGLALIIVGVTYRLGHHHRSREIEDDDE